jgi:hypothetical protein
MKTLKIVVGDAEEEFGSSIIYETPEVPLKKNIEGYNLPTKNQKFIRKKYPSDREFEALKETEQLEIVKEVLDKRKNGHWFMNNGEETYITGIHWFYLTFWKIDVGYPEYRRSDRDYFYFWDYCVKDPLCMGMINMENRRQGKTERSNCILYEYTSINPNSHSGIQSKTDADAKKVFLKLVRTWKRMPYWLKPIDEGESQPKSALRFFEPSVRNAKGKRKEYGVSLDSWIDFESAKEEAYDGEKLKRYTMDEAGKCFGFNTAIRMYDGSIKMVQDIKDGEYVMGNNNSKRLVYGTTKGVENMYKIIPNKGLTWDCNESHILHVSISDNVCIFRKPMKVGDLLNISVKDYLTLSDRTKRSLCLIRTGFDVFDSKEHLIDPYIFGVWLGDGNSREFSITTTDPEILSEFTSFVKSNDLSIRIKQDNISYIATSHKKNNNPLKSELRSLDVLQNKHIPSSYLFDSRENRLNLLAGIVDTDGHLAKSKKGASKYVEIVQKNEKLANDIYELAISLGFYVKKTVKLATMRRADKSLYMSLVIRLNIYGDIDLIPTKVPHKKAVISRTKNRRNPNKTGFKVESIGVGDYYGFAVDNNHLFLLADGTVVHNTTSADVSERWNIVRECFVTGRKVIGKALITTTVEEMDKKGGKNFKTLWDNSDLKVRDDNGFTKTGLYRYFKPAYYCLEGFIDEYGNPLIEDATTFLTNKRNGADGKGLASEKRKYPFKVEDAFGIVYGSFWEEDIKELLNQLEAEIIKNPPPLTYNILFERDGEIIATPVSKKDDKLVRILEPPQPNVEYKVGIDSISTDNQTGDESGSKLACVVMKSFGGIDAESYVPVCVFSMRPDRLETAYEIVCCIIKYYGKYEMIKVLSENNAGATNLLNYLINRGLKRFMQKKPKDVGASNLKSHTVADKYWIYRDNNVLEFQKGLANRFLRRYGSNIKMLSLVKSLQDAGVKNADEADAFLMAIMFFTDFDKVNVKTREIRKTMIMQGVDAYGVPIYKEV